MNKKVFIFLLLFCGFYISAFAKNFTAESSLVINPTPKERADFFNKNKINSPFLAVYQKDGKTLVLLAAKHGPQSLPAVEYAFDKYAPNVVLIEREPNFPLVNCQEREDSYTAALSAKNNIPLVRADADFEKQWEYLKKHGFSYEDFQMFWIIRNASGSAKHEGKQPTAVQEIKEYESLVHNPAWGELLTEESLLYYFKKHYHKDFNKTEFISFHADLTKLPAKKWVRKTPFYKIMNAQPDARSIFMLENITSALNQYQIVFSEMGSGHFIDIHKALEKMLSKPQYITSDKIPPQTLLKDCKLDGLKEIVLVP